MNLTMTNTITIAMVTVLLKALTVTDLDCCLTFSRLRLLVPLCFETSMEHL